MGIAELTKRRAELERQKRGTERQILQLTVALHMLNGAIYERDLDIKAEEALPKMVEP